MTDAPELTKEQLAELLIQGIESLGLDTDEELDKLEAMPPVKRAFAIQEFQVAGLAARMDKLPGA